MDGPVTMPAEQVTGMFDVSGKTVLVTGGSRGLGFMMAEGFVRAGARVVVASRKKDDVDKAAKALAAQGDCVGLVADLSSAEGSRALADAIAQRWDRLDVLVNNAGATWGAPIRDYPEEAWDKVIDTNLKGVFLLTVALLDLLSAAGTPEEPARVIMIGSAAGIVVPAVENYAYSVSKAGLHMLTRHLARRFAKDHVVVNAIAPGPFETGMLSFALDDSGRRAIEKAIPLGRLGRASDIVGAALYLASPAGAYVTGVVLPVDGGYSGTIGRL
jgi:NAD(P)-dependent dehydrogenase (short-subunit alcohol dehydrogenase family)